MKELFNLNSPWVQRFAMLTNLVCLNLLWLVCCIPVFTAGAATAALYHTVFLYHNKEDDAVLRPFFRAFRTNFKQSTLLFLPLFAALLLVVFDLVYLASYGKGTAVLFLLILVILLLMGMLIHLFPLIARFDMNAKALLRTAFSLTALHLPGTLTVIALLALPVILLLFFPDWFLRFGVVWAGVWFSAIAYFFGKFLLKIWNKHVPAEE
ncbi:MAG: YesL family protein [Oscillospiraceae bacterium]|nr:YesL family protein [Oscillospiraceae bacterium]